MRTYLSAYMGAALAVATKGLLGIAPVAFAFIFASFSKERKERIRSLVNPPVMVSAAFLAASWFAIMYWQHGHEELARFYQDQVGERLSGPKYLFLLNLKDYLWGFVRYFMPW
jgi:4-amino-4-deoxy-L-arabinose transferase-like glycosyltransferase